MPIICLEGASAVGKTTTALFLQNNYGAFIVPEVNKLFTRPENPPSEWYLERQVERWTIAQAHEQSHNLVVLDGDPFQPLWYNWAYNFVGLQSLEMLERFYQRSLQIGNLDFPDMYFLLGATKLALKQRRISDSSRKRSNFEKHLKMVEPQSRYFQVMKTVSPSHVYFLEAKHTETSANAILKHTAKHKTSNPDTLFDYLI
jgi:deoxyadenosine/deoxycytidine kinase